MVATRFAVAIHILLLLATEPGGQATSGRLADSVGTNPVVIRRLAGQLARAGLIRIRRGPGGAELARPAAEITLAEIWQAMRRNGLPLLPIHRAPNNGDAIGRGAPALLREVFDAAEAALESRLAGVTVADLCRQLAAAQAT
ncbi:Rrf2 family transcriptional regulator [Falsiroseomonas stagni]|uniref:DNA-binding transcriptional regulator, IscR family n=1 Tax=Falsiroseomonas stagni DSM 19981 TaxID=1123062 RepID=A0A1I3YD18_9PROT|nr:Rrf2 family transcriptional regulator [Falsiroseomonas stagni]SFK29702.1 DNA-binding transcriptional regulator, IscR family [Falsiroseomonas stagni DSM 19981]